MGLQNLKLEITLRCDMTYTFIAVSSITYAMKAKKLLNGMGYFCEVEKTPKGLSTGCGYSIRIKDNQDVILAILKKNGIKYGDSMSVNR